jgi:O-antigen/teichoic acid export membrane protein
VLTIGLNVILIPIYGFVACAYITLVIYGLMCVAAYWMGSHYFPIPYQPIKYIILIMVSLVFWYLSVELNSHFKVISLTILTKCILLALLLLIIWLLQPKRKKNKFATQ